MGPAASDPGATVTRSILNKTQKARGPSFGFWTSNIILRTSGPYINQHSCSGVRGKTKPYSLVLEVISELRNIHMYTSKRYPKKPNSLQSDISIFSGNTDNFQVQTHMVSFDLSKIRPAQMFKLLIFENSVKWKQQHRIRPAPGTRSGFAQVKRNHMCLDLEVISVTRKN